MKEALVVVTPGFPANEQDTTCLPAFQQFVLSLKKIHPQVIVLAFQYPFEKKEYLWHGIPVIALGGKNRGKANRLITWLNAYRALKKLAHTYRLTGMISLWITECALIAVRFSKKNNIPHMTWIIGQDAKPGNKYVARIKPVPGQLAAMSDFLQEEFYKNYAIKAPHVIENGINANAFPAYNPGNRPIDIFGAGSLIPLKNYTLFIDLVAALKKNVPAIHAVIAGDGPERQTLQEHINSLELQDTITLLGLQSHPETLALMAQSKVFLHTSVYEGNSTVLMEALYSGCQVVSTCPLSTGTTENLFTGTDQATLLKKLNDLFSKPAILQKRVVFNTMDDSAQRLLKLLSEQR